MSQLLSLYFYLVLFNSVLRDKDIFTSVKKFIFKESKNILKPSKSLKIFLIKTVKNEYKNNENTSAVKTLKE